MKLFFFRCSSLTRLLQLMVIVQASTVSVSSIKTALVYKPDSLFGFHLNEGFLHETHTQQWRLLLTAETAWNRMKKTAEINELSPLNFEQIEHECWAYSSKSTSGLIASCSQDLKKLRLNQTSFLSTPPSVNLKQTPPLSSHESVLVTVSLQESLLSLSL